MLARSRPASARRSAHLLATKAYVSTNRSGYRRRAPHRRLRLRRGRSRLLPASARTPGELAAMVARRARACHWNTSSAGRSSAGCGSPWTRGVRARRRTEFLVGRAADLAGPDAVIVDLCCGTGAVAAALARPRPCRVYAAEIDPAAVGARGATSRGRVYQGDLSIRCPPNWPAESTCRGQRTLRADRRDRLLPPEARVHEPPARWTAALDGLDIQRRVTDGASGWLAPGGRLLIETSERQAAGGAGGLRAPA